MHAGASFKTGTSSTPAFISGQSFGTTVGVIQAGQSFSTTYFQEICSGSSFSTSRVTETHGNMFNILPQSPTSWSDPAPAGSYPQVRPDVVIKHFWVFNGTVPTPINLGNGELQYNPNLTSLTRIDLAPFVKTFTMDQVLGGKWSFNATFEDHDYGNLDFTDGTLESVTSLSSFLNNFPSHLNPYYYGVASYNPYIAHHRFDIGRQISIVISVGKNGEWTDWTSPPFAPGSPHFDGYTLTWSGEDLSIIFEQEYQTFPDITLKSIPSNTSTLMAHDTILGMGRYYNFVNFQFNFPDYRIRELRRTKDKPINAIDKICRPYQALRSWSGQSLSFTPAVDPKDVSPQWIISDFMIEETGFSLEFNNDWKNKFTLARLKDQGGIYGQQTCTGGHCIGRTVDIKLSEPLDNVDLKTNVIGPAYLLNYTWFYKGAVVGSTVTPSFRGGGIKTDEVQATFEPNWNGVTAQLTGYLLSNTIPYTADYGYSIFASGGNNDAFGFSTTYTFKLTDTTGSVSQFGIRPDYTNIEDTIIPTNIVAKAYILAVMKQNIRRVWKLTFETRFVNNLCMPGQVLGIVDYLTMNSTVNWLPEKITLSMDEYGEWLQKFECYRGCEEAEGSNSI